MRRLSKERSRDRLAYISLQPDNGGIVLDVSEGGLSFCAAAPIEVEKLIRFRLSVKSTDRTESTGELVWNDKTRRSGGLRFIKLSDELHEQVRIWLVPPPLVPPQSGVGAGLPLWSLLLFKSNSLREVQPISCLSKRTELFPRILPAHIPGRKTSPSPDPHHIRILGGAARSCYLWLSSLLHSVGAHSFSPVAPFKIMYTRKSRRTP